MIEFQNVYKQYRDNSQFALENVSFKVHDGETLVLLGSSGSGKSTALKLMNRLLDATQGIIKIDNQDIQHTNIRELRHRMGYVFQASGLFPHLTIAENLMIPLKLLGQPPTKEAQRQLAFELLEQVQLDPNEYASRYPHQLSGGEQQRVSVARALSYDPEYLLMDEPFGALDAITRDQLQQEVLVLKKKLQKTIVFVTHDIQEAALLADRVAIFNQGVLLQIDTISQILSQPADDFVATLTQGLKNPCQ